MEQRILQRKSKVSKFLAAATVLLMNMLLSGTASAQAPALQWQKSFGGSYNDIATAAQQTTDGGYVMAGPSVSADGDITGHHGGADYWVVKLDSTGKLKWQKSLGGSSHETATSLQQTTDGGYIVAGYSLSTNGDVTGHHGNLNDYWVVKLDSTGNLQWQRSLGGNDDDYAYAVRQTSDGGYIVAGGSYSTDGDITNNYGNEDCWLVKLDKTGSILWQKSLGGSGDEAVYAIKQTTEGGYIIAGVSNSNNNDVTGNHGFNDYWVAKLDSTGSIQWQKSLGGNSNESAQAVLQTTDGGYIVAGGSLSTNGDITGNHGSVDCWVVKLDGAGSIQWQKSLGGSLIDQGQAVQQTTDGGYIVAGQSNSNDGDVTGNQGGLDYWVVKLDGAGSIQWQKSMGGSSDDVASAIQQTTDGYYIVAGKTWSTDGDVTVNHGNQDFWVVKLGAQGTLPLSLLSFSGTLQHSDAQLQWQTTNEINSQGFAVQHSTNGSNFTTIGNMPANNTPGTNHYRFTDTKAQAATNYYRLKMYSKDGAFTYSNTVLLANGGQFALHVQPNPAANSAMLTFNSLAAGKYSVAVTGLDGKTVKQVAGVTAAGSTTLALDISGLAKGVYMVTFNGPDGKHLTKLVKE